MSARTAVCEEHGVEPFDIDQDAPIDSDIYARVGARVVWAIFDCGERKKVVTSIAAALR